MNERKDQLGTAHALDWLSIPLALFIGTIGGVAIMLRKGVAEGRKTRVPFGPFLALGGVVGVLAGNELVQLYLGTF